jgi:hypothetical protein
MTPARLEIEEEHDRLDTAIDRAVDRASRLATPLGTRNPPPSSNGQQGEARSRTPWTNSDTSCARSTSLTRLRVRRPTRLRSRRGTSQS